MSLATFRAGYRFDMLGPPPAWLKNATADGDSVKPHDIERSVRKRSCLVRRIEVFASQCCHCCPSYSGEPHHSLADAPLHRDVLPDRLTGEDLVEALVELVLFGHLRQLAIRRFVLREGD